MHSCTLPHINGHAKFRQLQTALRISTHLPSQRLQADNNRVEVLSLPKVDSLESLLSGDAAGLSTLHEGVDVLHALEGHGGGLDLLDLTGLEGVNHPVESKVNK